jgi:HlyD family type I secretion membrane fusion protein
MKLDFLSLGGPGKPLPHFDLFAEKPQAKPRALDDASRIIRIGLIAAGAFFGLLLLFALLAPISGAAIAHGEVTTAGTRILIQPASGGVVAELLVGEGQSVQAGQPLVRLNGVRSAAAAQQAQARRDALRAAQARLIAERDGREAVVFPPDLIARAGDPVAAGAMANQQRLFQRRRAVLGADRDLVAFERETAEAQRVSAAAQLQLIKDELAGVRGLVRRGYATMTRLRGLERNAAELEGSLANASTAVRRAELQRARIAHAQLVEINAELNRIEEALALAEPALRVTRFDEARDTLRAPVSGRVSGVVRAGPGTVLGAGQTVMEVVPAGRSLVVEARVLPADADDVRIGMPASLRFTTVNPRGQSTIPGRVVALSPARIGEGGGQAGYFRAQIIVDDPRALERAGIRLQPGLPVLVHIQTRSRSLLDYLFTPVEDAMSSAFREE